MAAAVMAIRKKKHAAAAKIQKAFRVCARWLVHADIERVQQAFKISHHHSTFDSPSRKFYARLQSVRNEALDQAVAEAYAQDMACTGTYREPPATHTLRRTGDSTV